MTYSRDIYAQEIIDDLEHRNRMQRQQLEQTLKDAKTINRPNEGMVDRIDELETQLRKKDKLILEWMHTNAAFKKLTKDYAAQLGIPEEQRQKDAHQARVDVAERSPSFKETELYKESLEELKKSKVKP